MTETTVELTQTFVGAMSFRMSYDSVPAVWPREAEAWITWCRLWPLQDTIHNIVDKGCKAVPRSSPGGDAQEAFILKEKSF